MEGHTSAASERVETLIGSQLKDYHFRDSAPYYPQHRVRQMASPINFGAGDRN